MNLKWPKYGTKFSVSYALFIVGWALFGFNANVVMAKYLEVSALSTGIIVLQIGFLCSRDQTILKITEFFYCNLIPGVIYPIRADAHDFFVLRWLNLLRASTNMGGKWCPTASSPLNWLNWKSPSTYHPHLPNYIEWLLIYDHTLCVRGCTGSQ